MEEYASHGKVGVASMRANMDRHTGSKYLREGKLPSELKKPRTWSTRADPIADEDWQEAVKWLREAPELEAKARRFLAGPSDS